MGRLGFASVLLTTLLAACGGDDDSPTDAAPSPDGAPLIDAAPMPDAPSSDAAPPALFVPSVALPTPLANNAVASLQAPGGPCTLYTVMGVGPSRDWATFNSSIYKWTEGDADWSLLADIPLATTPTRVGAPAVATRDMLFVAGGYSVDASGFEATYRWVDVYDVITGAKIKTLLLQDAVQDPVMAVWDHYVMVMSGWAPTGTTEGWEMFELDSANFYGISAYIPDTVPRRFGASVAIDANNDLILMGGVDENFQPLQDAWHVHLSTPIGLLFQPEAWIDVGPYPGPPRFRAAGGAAGPGQFVFHGGAAVPSSYDGLTFGDRTPITPLDSTLIYDLGTNTWQQVDNTAGTMDHHGLGVCEDALYLVGGMVEGPVVSSKVWKLPLPLSL